MPETKDIYRGTGSSPPRRRRRTRRPSRTRKAVDRLRSSPERWAWILLLLVLLGYVGVLASMKFSKWNRARAAARPPAAVAEPDSAEDEPEDLSDSAFPITAAALKDSIGTWERADRALRETRALQGEPGRAVELEERLRKELESSPNLLNLQVEMARALHLQGRHEEACDFAFRVLDADPDHAAASLLLAGSLAALDRHAEALQVAEWIVKKDPLSMEGYRFAMRSALVLGQTRQAIQYLEKLLSTDPHNGPLLNQLALAHSRLGEAQKGISVLEKLLQRDPGNSVALFNLAGVHARANQADETVDVLSQAARDLGHAYVATWLDSPEFEPVRETPVFEKFRTLNQSLLSAAPGDPGEEEDP